MRDFDPSLAFKKLALQHCVPNCTRNVAVRIFVADAKQATSEVYQGFIYLAVYSKAPCAKTLPCTTLEIRDLFGLHKARKSENASRKEMKPK